MTKIHKFSRDGFMIWVDDDDTEYEVEFTVHGCRYDGDRSTWNSDWDYYGGTEVDYVDYTVTLDGERVIDEHILERIDESDQFNDKVEEVARMG